MIRDWFTDDQWKHALQKHKSPALRSFASAIQDKKMHQSDEVDLTISCFSSSPESVKKKARNDVSVSGVPSKSDNFDYERNVDMLREVFPSIGADVLMDHLKTFHNNPNCMQVIVDILLKGENSLSSPPKDQNSPQTSNVERKTVGRKRERDHLTWKHDSSEDSFSYGRQATETSHTQANKHDISKRESSDTKPLLCVGWHQNDSISVEDDIPVHKSAHQQNSTTLNWTRRTRNDSFKEQKSDSGVSPRKASKYHNSMHFGAKVGTGQRGGISIRHKGGSLHPSMKKRKELQIVQPLSCIAGQRGGISIRHKGESLHPSMKKRKELQIVQPLSCIASEEAMASSSSTHKKSCLPSLKCSSPSSATPTTSAGVYKSRSLSPSRSKPTELQIMETFSGAACEDTVDSGSPPHRKNCVISPKCPFTSTATHTISAGVYRKRVLHPSVNKPTELHIVETASSTACEDTMASRSRHRKRSSTSTVTQTTSAGETSTSPCTPGTSVGSFHSQPQKASNSLVSPTPVTSGQNVSASPGSSNQNSHQAPRKSPTPLTLRPNSSASPRSSSQSSHQVPRASPTPVTLSQNSFAVPGSSKENQNQASRVSPSDHTSLKYKLDLLSSDCEILTKVFPDADPDYVRSLLEEHADDDNRVAVVGKELGTNPNPPKPVVTKIRTPSATWFWETQEEKLIPFTDPECKALEREYSRCSRERPSIHWQVIKLPGSSKISKVHFHTMTLVDANCQESALYRVPCDSEEYQLEAEAGGRSKNPILKEELTVPSDWQQQSGNVELISVRPGSAEWDHVEQSLKRSVKAAIVTEIQRVQNKWFYRKYAIQRHLLKDKNGPTCINEKELFHGTRTTNPAEIWNGEDGFDMRYSADGMWGRGTYFAEKASYCHPGYSYYDAAKRNYQLFLAHVLTGDSVSLQSDPRIRMPPVKAASNIRYDSVNGVAHNCTVYILYKLDMAYPAYLITYTA